MSRQTEQQIASMDEQIALPRKNGELVFQEPWEARAFGLAVALNEHGLYPWTEFSSQLALQTAISDGNPAMEESAAEYYARWLATLEELLLNQGLVSREEFNAEIAEQLHHDQHDHEHDHHKKHVETTK